MRKKFALLTVLLLGVLMAACDKLEDSDVTGDTLIGRWTFSYKTSEPLDYELSYKFVTFNADGSCALIYDGGQLEGTYRASMAVIRIDATTSDGKEHTLLWRVLSMSPYQIVSEYEHEMNDSRQIRMTVTLDKLP